MPRNVINHPFLTREHTEFRLKVRSFVTQEILPFADIWEAEKAFPRDLYLKAGKAGFLGLGYPEAYGGTPCDIFHEVVYTEEIIRCGSVGLASSLGSAAIGLPPILALGTEEQKQKFIPPVLRGEKIAVLGVTEPSGGSDVANLQTTAQKDGRYYIVNGSKIFITSGTRADIVTTAVRTGGPGAGGISLLVIETDTPGFTASNTGDKLGWHASDTAELAFMDCRVPVENRLGEENKGFAGIMVNFQKERLLLALEAQTVAEMALESCIAFIKANPELARQQAIGHKIADMASRIEAGRQFNYHNAWCIKHQMDVLKQVCMAKNINASVCDQVVGQAMDIHSAMGAQLPPLLDRLFRDSRLFSIGGGTSEIMNRVIARRLGI